MSESEPLESFLYAIKSDSTKQRYERRLKNFLDFLDLEGDLEAQAKSFIIQSQQKGKSWVSAKVMKFLTFQKDRVNKGEITGATVQNYYKPLKLFLEMNDVELSWKKISRGLPRGRRHAADRAPTIEEIQKLIEYPDRRIRAIVFTMCSSGIRLGAWDYLKWKNVFPIEQDGKVIAAKLVVYFGDEEQYNSFISSEAYQELKKWMDFRKQSGEKISEDSWLMRDLWNIEKFARGFVTAPKQLKSAGVKSLIERALKAQGIRKNLLPEQKRHEFQTDHGFRKFFKTRAEQIMKPINVETLMGHSTGISDSYYRPSVKELLEDYLKAIPYITVSKEKRMVIDVEKLRKHSSEIEITKNEITQLKEKIRKIELRNEIVEMVKSGMVEWSEKNSDKVHPLQIAKADFRKTKGIDEMVEHFLTEHNGT